MSRELTAFVEAALSDENLAPFFAVDLLFDAPNQVYLWTGTGTLSINGTSYIGAGELMGISEIAESAEIAAIGARLTLSSMPTSLLQKALSEPYHGRRATIHFGFLGDPDAMIEIFGGYMDQMPIDEGADGGTISVTLENKLIDLERPRVRKLTPAFQESLYPGDTGLRYVPGLQDQKLPWGLGVPG